MQAKFSGKQDVYLEISERYKEYIRLGIIKNGEKLRPFLRYTPLPVGISTILLFFVFERIFFSVDHNFSGLQVSGIDTILAPTCFTASVRPSSPSIVVGGTFIPVSFVTQYGQSKWHPKFVMMLKYFASTLLSFQISINYAYESERY